MIEKVGYGSIDLDKAKREYEVCGDEIRHSFGGFACQWHGNSLFDGYGMRCLGNYDSGYLNLSNGNRYYGGSKNELALVAAYDCEW